MDSQQSGASKVLFLAGAVVSIIAVCIGIAGILMLAGFVPQPLTTSESLEATSTARSFSIRATSTTNAIRLSKATEQARWAPEILGALNRQEVGGWPLGDLSDGYSTVNATIDSGVYQLQVATEADVHRCIWSSTVVDRDFVVQLDVAKATGMNNAVYGVVVGDPSKYYTLMIHEPLRFGVGIVKRDVHYDLIEPSIAYAINLGQHNTLMLISEEGQLIFILNGQRVGSAEGHQLEGATIGVCYELQANQEAVLHFGNVSMYTLSE
jgi:hypothetical protein